MVAALPVQGELITPDHPAYDEARRVFNGMIDRRPALIVRCASSEDVRTAIAHARTTGLPLAIRGGGHNVAGNAMCDGGVVIDLSDLHEVRVDTERKVAVVQPGATWYDFDQATQAHGLSSTGGLISSTGVAGFTLGGGIGWLVRKFGLACDNLIAADVVDAAGETRRASAQDDSELLWGLRGGGGNFGVVTSFEFQLHALPEVSGGMVAHPRERARDVLRFFRDISASAPAELTLIAALMTTPEGHPAIAVAGCYAGPAADAEKVLAPLHEFGPPVLDQLGPIPYTVLQTALDPSAPKGSLNYWKSDFMPELSDEAIDLIVEHANRMASPMSQMHVHLLGGAMANEPAGGAAFAHRDSRFVYNLIGMWTDPAENDRHTGLVRDAFDALRPVSMGGAYINFLGDDGADRVRAAYGENYDRLARLKTRMDPSNLFRFNQNIAPA